MERFAAINDRYVSFLKSEISMHLFCYPGFTCGAVGRCNNSTNPICYSNCCSSSRLSVGLFSRESSFTGTCTPSGASASYSSTAGSTISAVRTHSFVPSTFTAAWVCFAKNRVSGYTSIQISLFPSFCDSSKISYSPQCRCTILILFTFSVVLYPVCPI